MLAFADQAERTDFASNKLSEDCVVVSGDRCGINILSGRI